MYASDAGIALKATATISAYQDEVVLSVGSNTYNYYLLRFSGGGQSGIEEPTNWQTFVFINTQNPEQSFYAGDYNTVFWANRIDINNEFNILYYDFSGSIGPQNISCKFITDDGIKLKLSCDEYEKYKSTYDYYVFPFKVELYAF